jgi:hypothetical protein
LLFRLSIWLCFISLAGCADVLEIEQKREVTPERAFLRPPERPSGPAEGVASKLAFAARRFHLGAVEPETGAPDPLAWRSFGFDIDGLDTPADGMTTCQSPSGKLETLADGDAGRDNNFGARILRILAEFSESPQAPETGVNTGIEQGWPTLLVTLTGVNEGPDDPAVEVGLYVTAPSKTRPGWGGGDRLSVDPRTVEQYSIVPRMRFARGYMKDHVVVSGDFNARAEAPFLLPLDPSIGMVLLRPLTFTLTFELDPDHQRVLSSTLSMVLTIPDLVHAFEHWAVRFGVIECGAGALLDAMVRPTADLRSDGPSFNDPSGSQPCDAVSVAFRLEWAPVRIPTISDLGEAKPGFNPCAE